MDDNEIFDVAIVGYGPVGAALAILLGQHGSPGASCSNGT